MEAPRPKFKRSRNKKKKNNVQEPAFSEETQEEVEECEDESEAFVDPEDKIDDEDDVLEPEAAADDVVLSSLSSNVVDAETDDECLETKNVFVLKDEFGVEESTPGCSEEVNADASVIKDGETVSLEEMAAHDYDQFVQQPVQNICINNLSLNIMIPEDTEEQEAEESDTKEPEAVEHCEDHVQNDFELNNLSLATKESLQLRRSRLNVTEVSPSSSPVEDTQADQLYPSLNDDYFQGLTDKSIVLNRSVSQQSCYSHGDVDNLSMQCAEERLNHIPNYFQESDDIEHDEDLRSFEVVMFDENNELCDLDATMENTVHHSSLRAGLDKDVIEDTFQNYSCVTPAPSVSNFHELNQELLIDELRAYYYNPQLIQNDDFLKDFFSICVNKTHEFHQLIMSYRTARDKLLEFEKTLDGYISKYKKHESNVWSFPKDKIEKSAYCADHVKVSHIETFIKAHCHQEILKEVKDSLEKISDNCSESLVLLQYNWKIAFYHVEEYIVNVAQNCAPLYHITGDVTAFIPGVIPWDHVNQTSNLRVCVSILFYFKREKCNDEVFSKDIDRWLCTLVGMLLRVSTLLDHRFILNHLLRCPTAFSFWGTSYLQFVIDHSTYNCETIVGNPIIDHIILMYKTLIEPIWERDNLLVEYEAPKQASEASEWVLMDEIGEVDCDDKQLLERDYLELLNQFNFGMLYREILRYQNVDEFIANRYTVNENEVMTLFSICLRCIGFIKEAFLHLDFTRYRKFCQMNAKILTTLIKFSSDYYYFYEGFGGKYEKLDHDPVDNKLLTLHDYVFQEGFKCLAETSNVSLWQFLADLPYHRVSLKILWRLYAFLHQVNPEKTLKDADIETGNPYDIVIKLYKTARFQRRLDSLSDEDSTFMVNVFCKMALSRTVEDANFIKIIGLDIYHIGVTASQEKQSTEHACKNCLSSIIQHCPSVVSALIESIEKPTLKDLPQNLKIFKGINLVHWLPSDNDFKLLATWLQSNALSSLTNQLTRIIIKGLNWNSYDKKLFIPVEVHRRWAVVIVAAHSYHLPDRPGYLINSPAQEFVKHVSNSEKNLFVHWCWEVLLSLCLNKSDVMEYNAANRRLARQATRTAIQRRQSDTTITSPRQHPAVGRQMSSMALGTGEPSAPPEDEGSAFVGKWGKYPYKIIKEESLAAMCEALRTSGEMAAFVALSITTLGHSIIDFQADGIPLLVVLQKAGQYRAMLNIISNLLSIVLKNKCVHLLINLPDFLPAVLMLTKAECCCAFTGRSGRPLTGLVVSKLVEGYQHGEVEGNLVLKFWIQLFFAIPNFHTEPSVVTLLDRMFRVVFRYGGDCQFIIDSLYTQLEKHLDYSKRNQSKFTNLVSWISGSSSSPTLLTGVSSPGEVFWWSYHVLLMECQIQKTSNFFHTLTEVLLTNPEVSIEHAVRRTHSFVTTEATAGLTPANLAIYRWGELLSKVPVEHPLLPFAWREFFKLYFYRPAPGTAGVGYRFFQGAFQQRDLRFMKQRLLDSAHNYEREPSEEIVPPEETPETLLSLKLSHFFTSLALWSEETRLHEANLYVPSLPHSYNGEKLADLLEQRDCLWLDLIDYAALDKQIDADRREWARYKERSYKPYHPPTVDDSAASLAELLFSYIRKNSSESVAPPPLVIPQSHIPITPDLIAGQLDGQAIISLLGPYFSKLKISAEEFVNRTSQLTSLNKQYIEDLPNKYTNKTIQNTQFVPCYNRMNPITHRCNGPASILITSTQYHDNPTVIEAVDANREDYEAILALCKQDLCDDICITAMYVEKLVSDLYRAHASCQSVGRKLFYHVTDNLSTSVWRYPPSQQIFAFSIDCLGQYFIRSAPEETMELLTKILLHNNFATVLAPLFHPNQGYEQFLKLYSHVITSMNLCKPDVAFMVLSKFDIRSWLTTPHSNVVGSKELINTIFLGFDVYGNSDDTNYLMFYDTLKVHLRLVLCNRLSALTQYVIEKTLSICVQADHHQGIWKEIVDVIQSEYGRQSLTLHACHRVLYELAKYFLQFRKSILKSNPNDLYSPWMPYIDNLLQLFSSLCHLYIEKASFLVPSEEYNYHIFNMVCTLFGPWILVFEEQCLPWSSDSQHAAGTMLSLFCELLTTMQSEIAFEGGEPLLNMFWGYYCNTLGHPIVPKEIINIYFDHLIVLPWTQFVPNVDVLSSLVMTVRKNRLTVNFVISILTMVDWQQCVSQLEKVPAAFDMLLDVLITFALNTDIFHRFSKDFGSLFKKFKALDLSLVSDEGYLLFMKRIDSSIQRNQCVQSTSNTGHLLMFMCSLCRFKQTGASYNKQISYFAWTVQIMSKLCNPQYIEIVINSLLYNIEQVFYISGTEHHLVALISELLSVFNMNIADVKTSEVIVRRLNVQLKDKVSVKPGFSFSQLSLYYLTSITKCVTNVRLQAILSEIVSESYFLHCEFTYPVLSVSWSVLDERFLLPDMSNESFINHSVNEGALLNLYLYTHHLLSQAENMDQQYFAVTTLIDCASRVIPLVGEEQKVLLLWFKIFDILIELKNNGIRSSVLHSSIRPLPATMLKMSEDREASGLFGTLGFGKKSKYSIEFRLCTKVIAAYILHQMNKDGSLRVEGATRHNLTTEANKAMDNVRSLLSNKAYAAHTTQIQHCIGTILDTSCTFLHTREIIRYLVQHCYGDKPYLAVIYYHSPRTASVSRLSQGESL